MTARKVDTHGLCDSLYTELIGMKTRLDGFIASIEQTDSKSRKTLVTYLSHLHELKSFIDWKIEIFSKVCPVDWGKHNLDVEHSASVKIEENRDYPAGGYAGG